MIRDVGEQIVHTAGVAVRPFWWSNECLEALGLKTYTLGPGGTSELDSGSEEKAAGEIETDAAESLGQVTDSPRSSALIIIATVLSLLLLAAIAYIIILSAKKKMISVPSVKSSKQPPHLPYQTSGFPAFCANCGKSLAPDSNFCPGCGKKIATP